MPSVYAPGVVNAQILFTQADEPIQCQMWFIATSPVTTASLNLLANNLGLQWGTGTAALRPTNTDFTGVEVLDWSEPAGLLGSWSPPSPIAGTMGGDALPNSNTLCISFRTGYSGKSNRGRNYWPGLPEAQVANNRVSDAHANDIKSFYEGMVGLNTVMAGFWWGTYSQISNKAPRLTGLFRPITNVVLVDTFVDSQRGRMP